MSYSTPWGIFNLSLEKPAFGDEPALVADRRRRPDRRQVSARWLVGTLLTGVTSTAMMGIALSAALEGHRGAARPLSLAAVITPSEDMNAKGERVVATAIPAARSRQIVELSTMTREGDREVIRTLPFGYVNMLLGARHQAGIDYPHFDPLKIFADPNASDGAEGESVQTSQLYGARVESEIRLRVDPFSFTPSRYEKDTDLSTRDAERVVGSLIPKLSDAPVQVASLNSVDPMRFALTSDTPQYEPGSAFRVIEENVSLAAPDGGPAKARERFHEEVLSAREDGSFSELLARGGHGEAETADAIAALKKVLGRDTLKAGDALRVGVVTKDDDAEVVRLSAYRDGDHLATVAATEDGPFEPAQAPEMGDSVAAAFDQNDDEAPMRDDMPTVYDGVYQAALSYGLTPRLCEELIHMLATEVDLQSRLSSTDRMAVFYSLEDGRKNASDSSEILYVEVRLGDTAKRFYRFKPKDDETADFFDPEGRSSKQFLLRKPVPNARFSSAFSTGRKHPVLGYVRPHWGIDWAAPRGSPIMAAGDGVVERSGWVSGYGRQTLIQHANGYETSYSHQSGFAKGLKPGAKVHQGQVIGYVGTTGISTGNHLHFEISVNGQKVDPMRIKLPSGEVLEGEDLVTFKRERDRIDNLLRERVESPLVATK